ncbi:putative chitinase [Rosellinia necatrix]|uniref:Putative chitinase n=1 Tax=Rosellinia necatrix TaxID=77044 RepID=A0A1S7UKZ3_ROSNE|nr:putative chitinase [Rosellinia necatrix]
MQLESSNTLPRLILYYQTTHSPDGTPCSIIPLITQPGISVTHLIVAAIHINDDPDALTLNDHPPSDPRFVTTWAELRIAQASGIVVMGMLGGAARGSYARLDQDQATFERYYAPLYELIRDRGLGGLDLDVEEAMSLAGVVRLIDRLRADFGPTFIITLAPVAAALLDARRNLSGFDYEALEVMRGNQIAWYNAQFYCGWGDASNPVMYNMCIRKGWAPEKVVVGLVTTPENGPGYVPFEILGPNLRLLHRQFPKFGGVMGWEYFNGRPGGTERPWEWAQQMTNILRTSHTGVQASARETMETSAIVEADDDGQDGVQAPVPRRFEYKSGSSDGED